MPILLKNATYINWKTLEFLKTDILIEEGVDAPIKLLEKSSKLPENQNITLIDCDGKLVTKSFAVGHHHVYSALATGMPAPKKAPNNFHEILQYIWWKLDKALDKEMIKASALATAISCAKSGSTFVIDHHSSPNCISGSLEIIAEAFEQVGLSHLLCYEISDRDGKDKTEKALMETERFLQTRQGLVGLHASFTVDDDTMKKAADLMEKYQSGIHIHVAEDLHDQRHCTEYHHKRVVDRLNDFGVLNSSKTILSHCLHLCDNERNTVKESNAYVAQNIESNLNNKVGFFNSEELGNRIMLGTDGMHSDMIRSTQFAHFVGQNFETMTFGNAYFRLRKVHDYLSLNNFAGDGDNNLVIFNYPSATPVNQENFLGHFLFGLRSEHVQHVISNGKLIVNDKKMTAIDEDEVLKFSKEQAERLWDKL